MAPQGERKIISLALKKLTDENGNLRGWQPRAETDQVQVMEFAELLRQGVELHGEWGMEFPVVFWDGRLHWLADGFTRGYAHREAGRKCMDVEEFSGGEREARLYAAGCNEQHGCRRNAEDRRRIVEMLLADPEWGKWNNCAIARQARVSEFFVRSIKKMQLWSSQSRIDEPEERFVQRQGTTYAMNTTGMRRPREVKQICPTCKGRGFLDGEAE